MTILSRSSADVGVAMFEGLGGGLVSMVFRRWGGAECRLHTLDVSVGISAEQEAETEQTHPSAEVAQKQG
jgi:hypothetical protein